MIDDAHAALLRALAARLGPGWRVLETGNRAWASATFEGERHHVVGESADVMALAGLAEAEFAIRGQIVADIAISAAADGRVTIEALTVTEA